MTEEKRMPKGDKKVMTLRFASDLYRRMRAEAERTYRPVATLVYESVDFYLRSKAKDESR